jgi:hypothetical protein
MPGIFRKHRRHLGLEHKPREHEGQDRIGEEQQDRDAGRDAVKRLEIEQDVCGPKNRGGERDQKGAGERRLRPAPAAQENDGRNDREPDQYRRKRMDSAFPGFVHRTMENTPDESQKECDLVRWTRGLGVACDVKPASTFNTNFCVRGSPSQIDALTLDCMLRPVPVSRIVIGMPRQIG